MSKKSYRQAINEALAQEMRRDPTVIVMGEDNAGGMGAPGEDDAWGGVLGVATLLIYQNLALSLVISAALTLNMLVAALIGVLAPVLLQRFGRDPAMGSSIILTATTDSMGFFIFLGLAAAFLV